MDLTERAKRVKLLLMDCDGVLTDGRLYFSKDGEELKVFDVRDGLGLKMWHAKGFASGIITGRESPIVDRRAGELDIKYLRQGVKDKAVAFQEIVEAASVGVDEAAFVGDDLPDLDAMRNAGFSIAVGDAVAEVKAAAHYVCSRNGGRGAVREVVDLLLAAKRE